MRPDGKISLPLLNDVPVAGLTPLELQAQLVNRLSEFIPMPEVTVIVTEIVLEPAAGLEPATC